MEIFVEISMHLRLNKGMLIRIMENKKFVTALVVSDVYMIKSMFHMIDVISLGKKRRIRTTWVREIIYE
jgi:hypothetical protein